jgi:Na+/H+ antiporter NhaD and related arsenite permeases
MIILMGILFIVGYMLISLEHQIKINKGAIALILSIVLWTIYMIASPGIVLNLNHESFEFFLTQNSGLRSTSQRNQVVSFVADTQLLQQVGDVAEVIFFLLGAMAVVEMIDAHKGFCIITDKITTHNKERLLWILSGITFFLSAVIDNMTTAIVMVTLLSKIIPDKQERWWYASLVVLASNAGGAWSPIGDVTSIMVWVKGAITPLPLVKYLLLPSLVSVLLPLCWVTRMLHRAGISTQITSCTHNPEADKRVLATDVNNHSLLILMLGIVGLC